MRRILAVGVALGVLASSSTGVSCGHGASPVAPSVTAAPTPTPTPAPTPAPTPLAPTITAQDAFSLIQSNSGNPGLVIIDVRTPAEFNGGHIANAINLDYYSPDFASMVGALDRNNRYVVYCRTGVRGAAATQIMRDIGFAQAQNLTGGITEWLLDGYPTVA